MRAGRCATVSTYAGRRTAAVASSSKCVQASLDKRRTFQRWQGTVDR